MTALRDSRGRFVTEAEHVATVLLEAAVAEAVARFRAGRSEQVENMFRQVTRSADLVLGREAS